MLLSRLAGSGFTDVQTLPQVYMNHLQMCRRVASAARCSAIQRNFPKLCISLWQFIGMVIIRVHHFFFGEKCNYHKRSEKRASILSDQMDSRAFASMILQEQLVKHFLFDFLSL